jgi:hypothetical protein
MRSPAEPVECRIELVGGAAQGGERRQQLPQRGREVDDHLRQRGVLVRQLGERLPARRDERAQLPAPISELGHHRPEVVHQPPRLELAHRHLAGQPLGRLQERRELHQRRPEVLAVVAQPAAELVRRLF